MDNQPVKRIIKAEDILNYYYMYWTTRGLLPLVGEVAKEFDVNPVIIQNYIDDQKFKNALVRRGLPLSSDVVLTPEQFRCIAIVTDPTKKGGLKARLKEAGVSYATFNAWKKHPTFSRELNLLAQQILENSLSDVNTALVQRAGAGDVNAIKFYYEVTGLYNPADKQVMDVMGVLASVVDILQKHITDRNQLMAIATELSMLQTKAVGGAAPRVVSSNYDTSRPLGINGVG